MKSVKIIIGAVVAIVALVLILVLALPLWIGPVACGVANAVAPKITGTEFKLGEFGLNPYSGVLTVGAMELGNPPKFDEKTAVKLDHLKVDVGMSTLCGKVIHVEDVTLDGLYVYASGLTAENFQMIAEHAKGDKKAEEKPAEEKKPEAESGEGKKVCIDKLTLKNVKVKIGVMPAIPVPTIELTDLGKPSEPSKEGGVTFAELWQTVLEKVMAATGSLGEGLKALGNLTGEGAKALGNVASEGAKAISNAAGEGAKALGNAAGEGAKAATEAAGKATEAVGNGAKALGDLTGSGAKAATEAAGQATEAVGNGAKAAGEAAGKAIDAVGEGAKKAANALKSLF